MPALRAVAKRGRRRYDRRPMIAFTCSNCGKTFRVPDEYAGRSARCRICGNQVTVPTVSAAPAPVPVEPPPPVAPAVVPMRTRRLRADAEAMTSAFQAFEPIAVEPLAGDPPEAYQVRYAVYGLERGDNGEPRPRGEHAVEIQLTSDYPRLAPKVKMLTPVFHPNIDTASVCVGDHWTAGERLVDLVIRIGEMLGYQAYNIQSPLDGEAAMWADLHQAELPVDPRSMIPPQLQ